MSQFPDIWIYDCNVSVYDKNNIYCGRGDWVKREVVSETRVSWVLSLTGGKIRKKGPWFNVAFSLAEVARRRWAEGHRYKIAKLVEDLRYAEGGFEKLKAVAELLSYEVKAPT